MKRWAALLLAAVMSCGLLAVPVAAADRPTIGENIGDIAGSLWEILVSQWAQDAVGGFINHFKDEETPTAEGLKNSYTSYTVNIQNNYGTATIDSSGNGLIPLTGWRYVCGTDEEPHHSPKLTNVVVDSTRPSITAYSSVEVSSAHLWLDFSVPAMGDYQLVFPSSTCSVFSSYDPFDVTAPGVLYPSTAGFVGSTFSAVPSETLWVKYRLGFKKSSVASYIVDFVSSGPVYLKALRLFPSTDTSVSPDSRPGSLAGLTYAYQNDTGEIIVYADKGSGLFNEAQGCLYNPVTGDTLWADSWYYDYENRRYDIALKNNQGQASVEYGEETASITIPSAGGNTTYNYYYVLPEDPTPSPSVSPSPSPTPSATPTVPPPTASPVVTPTAPPPSASPVVTPTTSPEVTPTVPPGGGGDDGGGGIWDLITGFFTGAGKLLGAILSGILSLLTTLADGVVQLIGRFTELGGQVLGFIQGGFLDFLAGVFPFLPPEIVSILTLGIVLLVAAAVLKKFL